MERINVRGIIAGGLFVMFALANLITEGEFDPIGTGMWFIIGVALIAYNVIAPRVQRRAAIRAQNPSLTKPYPRSRG